MKKFICQNRSIILSIVCVITLPSLALYFGNASLAIGLFGALLLGKFLLPPITPTTSFCVSNALRKRLADYLEKLSVAATVALAIALIAYPEKIVESPYYTIYIASLSVFPYFGTFWFTKKIAEDSSENKEC